MDVNDDDNAQTDDNKVAKNVFFTDVNDDAKTATIEVFNQLYEEDFDDDQAKLTDHDAIMF